MGFESAFDDQDTLSNYLGSDFYKSYYDKHVDEMPFNEILEKYFKERAKDRVKENAGGVCSK